MSIHTSCFVFFSTNNLAKVTLNSKHPNWKNPIQIIQLGADHFTVTEKHFRDLCVTLYELAGNIRQLSVINILCWHGIQMFWITQDLIIRQLLDVCYWKCWILPGLRVYSIVMGVVDCPGPESEWRLGSINWRLSFSCVGWSDWTASHLFEVNTIVTLVGSSHFSWKLFWVKRSPKWYLLQWL